MNADPQVLAHLNEYLSFELTGHRQYLVHGAQCRQWGFERLARRELAYVAEESAHAERILARLLLLGGAPTPRDVHPVAASDSAPTLLARDRDLVARAIAHLREAVAQCERSGDYASRALLVEMMDDEERHLDWLDTELGLLDRLGPENYLQAQLG